MPAATSDWARAPRRGLRGQSSQVHPTTFASRAVRWNPVTCLPAPRHARDGRARDWGPSRHGSIRRHTARRRPNRCAAHREPFSYVEVDSREVVLGTALDLVLPMNGYGWSGAGKRVMGWSRRRKCQSARQQPAPIGARAEARLAWSKPSSASDHICKPSRSSNPRIVFPRVPVTPAMRRE